MNRRKIESCSFLATLAWIILCSSTPAKAQTTPAMIPAFPGAEGFGAHSLGGRGGRVYVVTTLADYDPLTEKPIPGSFRAAADANEPRIVVFAVSGTIELKAQLWLLNDRITIAGQTAPGDGICIKDHPIIVRNKDVIIRYLRFRLGDVSGEDGDSLRSAACHNVILDHCSVSWGTDNNLRIARSSQNVTVQWCVISESLTKLGNGFGATVSENAMSLHHNLFAHNRQRNPKPIQGLTEFFNNIVYNWEDKAGSSPDNERLWVNYIGNYFKPGPSTSPGAAAVFWPGKGVKVFAKDNLLEAPSGAVVDSRQIISLTRGATLLTEPATLQNSDVISHMDREDIGKGIAITLSLPEKAYEQVLASAGASVPKRDAVDGRIVQSVRDGKGALIKSQADVGGWPMLKSKPAPADTDGDGMPDQWEQSHGLNPNDASDSAKAGEGGYTNIEVYLDSLVLSPAAAK